MIAEWQFYAVALPAVLILGLSKSGFASGFGLLAVPLMATVVPIPTAAAILMPVLLVVDLMGLAVYGAHIDRALMRFLLPRGLVGILLGAALFRWVDVRWISAIVGSLTLVFLLQRLLAGRQSQAPALPPWAGGILAVVSGFTSFVAHAGSPPINAYLASKRMAPLVFTGTTAFFFFVLNLSKWVPYAWLGLTDARNMLTSLVLLPAAPLGLLLGLRIARRLPVRWFYLLVYAGMFVSSLKLLWDAGR